MTIILVIIILLMIFGACKGDLSEEEKNAEAYQDWEEMQDD